MIENADKNVHLAIHVITVKINNIYVSANEVKQNRALDKPLKNLDSKD